VNTIAIVSVNDAFVMNAWKRDTDQRDEATFLADGNAEFTKAIGMELDASGNGLGIPLQALLDAGGRRRGEEIQSRTGAGQGRGFRRRYAARAAVRLQYFAAIKNRRHPRERVIQYSRALVISGPSRNRHRGRPCEAAPCHTTSACGSAPGGSMG